MKETQPSRNPLIEEKTLRRISIMAGFNVTVSLLTIFSLIYKSLQELRFSTVHLIVPFKKEWREAMITSPNVHYVIASLRRNRLVIGFPIIV